MFFFHSSICVSVYSASLAVDLIFVGSKNIILGWGQ